MQLPSCMAECRKRRSKSQLIVPLRLGDFGRKREIYSDSVCERSEGNRFLNVSLRLFRARKERPTGAVGGFGRRSCEDCVSDTISVVLDVSSRVL